ncbi:helix-turn-helix domain-containing protein [Virgibacillus soli]|uniref:Helix-turn-helix transcriptional regulator n=1 Tax=Paracerasibacillus soli TaxID=480284 RepID=A0ABU5CUA0_9BACI|nr:helix-turn-helix transcriptional regulator [Virgibacillus soli]MDY0409954.1 helix-turn-helix transcriptional regulator [Virgibacillus soli]
MNKIIVIRLKEVLTERGLEQKQLAEMTGLTERTISELVNNKTLRYPKSALESIINALDITDINDIITLVDKNNSEVI